MEQQHQQPWNPEELERQATMQEGGWDSEGMYHDPGLRLEPLTRPPEIDPSKAYRLAEFLNQKVLKYVQDTGYPASAEQRDDIAMDIVCEHMLSYDALTHWRAIYGGSFRDGK